MPDVDAVVIGSGAGGLTAALGLAQAGQKVLVLEQHYLPGGWCHSFSLGGYRFSPGVHYVGELGPGGRLRAIYEGLGVGGDLAFIELAPDGYDHVLVAGERFDIPRGKEAYAERLARRFPDERRGVRAYLDACERIHRELGHAMDVRSPWDALRLPLVAPTALRFSLRSARALIGAHARHPRLRAILAAQSGDHGLPPSRAPALLHAALVGHYLGGGWYPRGGGAALPRAFLKALRRAGGELRVRAPVARILVEDRRAVGVRLEDGTEIRARHVVCNADPGVTFGRLVGAEHLSSRLRRKLARTRWSVSALSLFCATDMDLGAAGLDSGNYWFYASDDVDGIYERGLTASGREHDAPPGLFLTVTTLKDPGKPRPAGHHTLEAFSFAGWEPFRRWAHTRYGDRPEDYRRMKEDLLARMIRGLGRIVPGLDRRLVFAELGTPLSNLYFVGTTDGCLYGTEKSLGQLGPLAWPVRTEIEGLTMCGASTLGHGVLGATASGLAAARSILRCRTEELLGRGGPPPALLTRAEVERPARAPAPGAPGDRGVEKTRRAGDGYQVTP